MKIDKLDKYLWDIETDKLNEISFQLYLNYITSTNKRLEETGREYRASYATFSDFLKYKHPKKTEFYSDANIIMRKNKIEKICKRI